MNTCVSHILYIGGWGSGLYADILQKQASLLHFLDVFQTPNFLIKNLIGTDVQMPVNFFLL